MTNYLNYDADPADSFATVMAGHKTKVTFARNRIGYLKRRLAAMERCEIPTSRAKNARDMGHPSLVVAARGQGRVFP